MAIPDIGGILSLSVHATGFKADIPCMNLSEAMLKLKQFKENDPQAVFEVVSIYHPYPFSIGE
jgi:hypothetical protein